MMEERSARDGRMDKSLDEIAAEMNSARDSSGAERHKRSSAHRYTPYGQTAPGSRRDDKGTEGGTKVFAANLKYSVTWMQLKDHMKQVGQVDKCEIFKNPNGTSKGMGLVVYADSESAERALRELSDTELEGRRLFLRQDMKADVREQSGILPGIPRSKPMANPAATVFVGNLDYAVTWQKVKDIFKVAGKIVNVDLQTDKDGRSKGYALVQFEIPSDALNAIVLFHGQMLHDRPMTVRMDTNAPFRPDPLQLKMSSGPNTLGGVGHQLAGVLPPQLAGGLQLTAAGAPNPMSMGGLALTSQIPLLAALGLRSLTPEQLAILNVTAQQPQTIPSLMQLPLPPAASVQAIRSARLPTVQGALHGGSQGLLGPAEQSFHVSLYDAGQSGGGDMTDGRGQPKLAGHQMWQPLPGGQNGQDYGQLANPKRKLFVKNLSYKTTWQRLKNCFNGAGEVLVAKVMMGSDGTSRGCAVVVYETGQEAQRAIEMFNNTDLDGRKMIVQYKTETA